MTVAKFTASLAAYKTKLTGDGGQLDRIVQGVAFECAENVVVGGDFSPGTPVLTGFARSSWWVRINGSGDSPPSATRPLTDHTGKAVLLNGDGAVIGSAVLDHATLTVLGAKAGDIIEILNNVEYIGFLERGTSKQAPTGFVRLTVAHGQEILDKVAGRILAGA